MLVTATERKDVKTGRFIRKVFEYDAFGNVERVVDELGNVTEFSSDPYGIFFTKTKNAKGFETSYAYDYAVGMPTKITDPNGISNSFAYDGF